jgi:hypothetical protein
VRKVGGQGHIFIDFYVPVLTPHLNNTEPSLQFSENITFLLSVAYIQVPLTKQPRHKPSVWGVSFMYKLYNVGDRMEPCGTPACISLGIDISLQLKF